MLDPRIVKQIESQRDKVLLQCATKEGIDLSRAQGGFKQLEWVLEVLEGRAPAEKRRAIQRNLA